MKLQVAIRSLFLCGVVAACLSPVKSGAQTNCSACWNTVSNWQGSYSLSVVGIIQEATWSGTVSNASEGSFWITNGVHTVHGMGILNTSATAPDCCPIPSGCVPFIDTCAVAASGALDANGHVGLRIDTTNCQYTLLISDAIGTVAVDIEACTGGSQLPALGVASCDLAQPVGVGLGVLPYFPLPAFGEHLTGSSTFPATTAATGCAAFGQFTLTLTWDIEPLVDSSPPRFTQLPTGGPTNRVDVPDDSTILNDVQATAPSGLVSITATHTDATNASTVTRTFTLTATDDCLNTQVTAAVAYWWSIGVARPLLNLKCSGANVILSWSTNATGLSLVARNDLRATTPWTVVTNAQLNIGGQFTVTCPIVGPSRYFALVY